MNIEQIISENEIIHTKKINIFLDFLNAHKQYKYLYMTDYDTPNSININNFKLKTDVKCILTKNIIKHAGELDKTSFNSFVYDKIHNEKYNVVIYDFIKVNSICFVANMFYNTRVYKNKTIVGFSYKLPPAFRENVDITLDE